MEENYSHQKSQKTTYWKHNSGAMRHKESSCVDSVFLQQVAVPQHHGCQLPLNLGEEVVVTTHQEVFIHSTGFIDLHPISW